MLKGVQRYSKKAIHLCQNENNIPSKKQQQMRHYHVLHGMYCLNPEGYNIF